MVLVVLGEVLVLIECRVEQRELLGAQDARDSDPALRVETELLGCAHLREGIGIIDVRGAVGRRGGGGGDGRSRRRALELLEQVTETPLHRLSAWATAQPLLLS